ncbi:N-acetylneuraminate synthase family protein [Thiomicrorhabdus sediminis]|uniref:AFP-like domain-containing protein n=1 Tax=Thiomicrorhabdus sediminis TaxID=2580412 RepID=A0A4P9K628_9GAMM|nr:N-acetylneuraminate synthase family protein [Thiomicrorhabdus sediminis]QCU90472.1 hypothetical protein FE785_07420 [Thiomicrorhabdus sediminis]
MQSAETNLSYWQQIQNTGQPLFLPDIGTYFNQDMAQAKSLVDELVKAGVKTIKGEILQNADICLNASLSGNETYWGHQSQQKKQENYRQLIERKVVSLEAYQELFEYAKAQGCDIIVSVYDFEGALFAQKIGVKAIKIASSNITHQPLIEFVAELALPIIIDTGHSSFEEIARAVNWMLDAGGRSENLLLEHSPLGPPNPVETHNLRFMQTLGNSFGVAYGLSDHYFDDEMLYAATAMGATVLEKGVCPNNMGDEQDGGHALPISQVKTVFAKIQAIATAMGDGVRHLPRERDKYISRMGLIAKTDIKAGDRLDLNNIGFAFPALGIGCEYWSEVNAKVFAKPVKAGQVINWDDVRTDNTAG